MPLILPYKNKKLFIQPIKGNYKGDMLSVEDKYISLNGSEEENIDIFFLSRLYRFLNIKTFKTYIGKSEDETLILMNDLFYNTNNIQIRNDILNINEEYDRDIFYSIYINSDLYTDFIKRNVAMSLLQNFDNIATHNMIFSHDSIYLIDLDINKTLKTSGFPFVVSYNHYVNVFTLFKEYQIYNVRDFLLPVNNNYANTYFNTENNLQNDYLKKADIIKKYSKAKFLKEYKKNYASEYGSKDSDILLFLDNSYENIFKQKALNIVREYAIELMRNIILLDDSDIDYITLNYKPLPLISNEDIKRIEDFIKSKQLELFYYAKKYKYLHKILKYDESEEVALQDEFAVELDADMNKLYFKDWQYLTVDKFTYTFFVEEKDYNSCIKRGNNYDNFINCYTKSQRLPCIELLYINDLCAEGVYHVIFNEWLYVSQNVKSDLKKQLPKFQAKLRERFGKKELEKWNDESFNEILYGDVKEKTIKELITIPVEKVYYWNESIFAVFVAIIVFIILWKKFTFKKKVVIL
ncbi:MAG: hypothetical protein Ta2D_01690 [Rickettsiales bacterium]|nr:MAG: hypothetical protein Ta2D_01690 [Rickettsiales bacterium]